MPTRGINGMSNDKLYLKKEFRAARASSFARDGRNNDSLPVPAGHKIVLANIDGPGIVKHIWMTTDGNLDSLVLRIYWDNAEFPSVEAPFGSFFGAGFGRPVPLNSAAIVTDKPEAKGEKNALRTNDDSH